MIVTPLSQDHSGTSIIKFIANNLIYYFQVMAFRLLLSFRADQSIVPGGISEKAVDVNWNFYACHFLCGDKRKTSGV